MAAGVVGALLNSLAIRAVTALGVKAGTGGLAAFTLAQLRVLGLQVPVRLGPWGQELFHTAVGALAALTYALFAFALLPGGRILRALIFVQLLFLAQSLVVLPWLGKGAFGWRFGPWTPLWSFALNAVFGIVLGILYRPRRKGIHRGTDKPSWLGRPDIEGRRECARLP